MGAVSCRLPTSLRPRPGSPHGTFSETWETLESKEYSFSPAVPAQSRPLLPAHHEVDESRPPFRSTPEVPTPFDVVGRGLGGSGGPVYTNFLYTRLTRFGRPRSVSPDSGPRGPHPDPRSVRTRGQFVRG